MEEQSRNRTMVNTYYGSIIDQMRDMVIEHGGLVPQSAEFKIHDDETPPYISTVAYVPNSSALDKTVQGWVDDISIGDGSEDLPPRDGCDRVSIRWNL